MTSESPLSIKDLEQDDISSRSNPGLRSFAHGLLEVITTNLLDKERNFARLLIESEEI